MTQFARVIAATSVIDGAVGRPDPVGFAGVPDMRPFPHDGYVYQPWQDVLSFSDAPTSTHSYEWTQAGPAWVERGDIEAQRENRAAYISQCCADAILAGFACDALGAGFAYPAKFTDQLNLTGSVMDSLMPGLPPDWSTPFWCADADGQWAFRAHSASQIQQVGRCAKAAALACMATNEEKQAQIAAAATPAQIAAITWPH